MSTKRSSDGWTTAMLIILLALTPSCVNVYQSPGFKLLLLKSALEAHYMKWIDGATVDRFARTIQKF